MQDNSIQQAQQIIVRMTTPVNDMAVSIYQPAESAAQMKTPLAAGPIATLLPENGINNPAAESAVQNDQPVIPRPRKKGVTKKNENKADQSNKPGVTTRGTKRALPQEEGEEENDPLLDLNLPAPAKRRAGRPRGTRHLDRYKYSSKPFLKKAQVEKDRGKKLHTYNLYFRY